MARWLVFVDLLGFKLGGDGGLREWIEWQLRNRSSENNKMLRKTEVEIIYYTFLYLYVIKYIRLSLDSTGGRQRRID